MERVSELIQKLLDIGGCDANTEWLKGYDAGVNNAINVVEEYFKQPQLNKNQQIVLAYLKYHFGKYDDVFLRSIFDPIHHLISEGCDDDVDEAFWALNLKQEAEVLQAFIQWALEQGEADAQGNHVK